MVLSDSEQEWDGDEHAESPNEERPVVKRQRLTKARSSNGTIDSLAKLPAVSAKSKDQRKSSVKFIYAGLHVLFLMCAHRVQAMPCRSLDSLQPIRRLVLKR